MRIFDLHCDTLTEAFKREQHLHEFSGHVSLAHGAQFDQWAQLWAIFVPDTLQGQAAADYFDRVAAHYHAQLGELSVACTPLLALENGNALAGDLARLDHMHTLGVRAITLTWNGENELGYGVGTGSTAGLKPFGKQAVQRMHELSIHPDVSHLNPAGFWDVAAFGQPLLATHSCCAAMQPHRRNLDDKQLRAIFASGGLVGLCLHADFLGGTSDAQAVARHLAHMLELGGENCVALGSDFDGCTVHESLAGLDKLPHLHEDLAQLGFSEHLLTKFFWSNASNFFRQR
ncbi:MAG: membrane dipeptidase [Oscillospiraceae bacterium]|nr:membrane dipeptidase [Oscillospiraceae bacterium]